MARILIAEDEAHILRVLSIWLTRNGHQVVEAHDGRAALTLLGGEERIDLIISDVNMPGMNGVDMIRAAREQLGLHMPCLMLSSRCDQAALAERVGPYDVRFYPKPFLPSRLVTEIEQMLRARTVTPGATPPST